MAKFRLDRFPPLHGAAEFVAEEMPGIAARGFRLIESQVGAFQYLMGVVAMVGEERDADRGADLVIAAFKRNGIG